MLLRGRCRDCKAAIPWRYPAVELAASLWFGAVAHRIHSLLATSSTSVDDVSAAVLLSLSLAALGLLLIALLVIDWQTHTLPDVLTFPGIGLGVLLACGQAALLSTGRGDIHLHPSNSLRISSPGSSAAHGDVFLTGTEAMIFGRIGAILAAALILLLIRWIYFAVRGRHRSEPALRHGLGLGDVKLLALIAAFLGLAPAILSLFLGVLLATAYALVLLARRRANALTRLPFGSFLALGGLLTALTGDRLLAWYKSLL